MKDHDDKGMKIEVSIIGGLVLNLFNYLTHFWFGSMFHQSDVSCFHPSRDVLASNNVQSCCGRCIYCFHDNSGGETIYPSGGSMALVLIKQDVTRMVGAEQHL